RSSAGGDGVLPALPVAHCRPATPSVLPGMPTHAGLWQKDVPATSLRVRSFAAAQDDGILLGIANAVGFTKEAGAADAAAGAEGSLTFALGYRPSVDVSGTWPETTES